MKPAEVIFFCGASSMILFAGLLLGRISGAAQRREVGPWQLTLKELLFVTMLAAFCIKYLSQVPWAVGLANMGLL